MRALTRPQVLGSLKATGTTDPDVLYAATEGLVHRSRLFRTLALVPMAVGGLLALTLTVAGALVGLPLVAFGWWVRRRAGDNLRLARSALADYLDSTPRPLGGRR